MKFGKITLAKDYWLIRCEPHVRARLKRVFARAPKEASSIVHLRATPENSRELLWFTGRYPMDLAEQDAAALRERAAAHVAMEASVAEMIAGRASIPAFDLAKPARDYQTYGAAFMEPRRGLLLADDVGLGKTVTAICPMSQPEKLPAVVVRPAYMPGHWEAKLAEFAPHLRVHSIDHGKPYSLIRTAGDRRRRADLWPTLPDVIVVTYHMLRGWADMLSEIARYAVLDEVQQLRHDDTQIYRAARHLLAHATWRMGLSATPIYNYGAEFFPVLDALLPGSLGARDEFIREWCIAGTAGEKARLTDPEQFGEYLRREGVMLRRTRRDVGRELPPVQKIVHTVQHDEKALEKLTGDAVALARAVLAHNERYRGERMQASGQFNALMRQATGLAKAPFVAEFVKLLVESGEKVLVYGWHHGVYGIWRERWKGLQVVFYTGEESQRAKLEAKQRFIEGDAQILVMSLRSGAGVDGLQDVCSTVVFGELDWSPGVHEQCIGRVDRDGMDIHRPVVAYFLTADDGCDPIMIDVLGVKREQIEGVRNPGQGLLERVDVGEDTIRQLARSVLEKHGHAVPADTTVTRLQDLTDA